MSSENLEIVVSSDVAGGQRGLDSLGAGLSRINGEVVSFRTNLGRGTTAITTFSNGAAVAATNIGKLAPPLTQFNGSLQVFVAQARAGQLSFTGLANGAQSAGRAVTSTNAAIAGTRSPADSAANALTNVGRVASDLPFGFIAIQNNLDPLVGSLGILFRGANGAAGGFKALGQALVGPAGIGLAFSVVSSAITVLIQKYGSLSNAFTALNPFVSSAAKAQAAYNKAVLDGGQAAQEEITHVNLLYAATQDLNVPLDERKKIADQLIKQYPQSFKGLTDEAFVAGKAADAYKQLSQQLLATATVKAAEGAVIDQQKALFKLRLEARKLNDQLAELRKPGSGGILDFGADPEVLGKKIAAIQNDINGNTAEQNKLGQQTTIIQEEQLKLIRQFGASAAGVSGTGFKSVADILRTLSVALSDVDTRTKLLGTSAKDAASAKLGPLNAALNDLLNAGLKPTSAEVQNVAAQIRQLAPISATKNVKSVSDIIKDLNNDLIGLDTAFAATGGSLRGLTTDKISRIGRALESLSDIGVRPGDATFTALSGQIDTLQNAITRTPVTLKITPALEILPKVNNQNTIDNINAAVTEPFKKALVDVGKILNDTLKTSLTDGIASVAEGIGAAISGGGIKAALGGFINLIAGFGESLGKQLIAQGVALIAFNASLKSLNGPTAIIAGAALIAASAAFRSLAKGGVASFATGGGVVGGPQLAMIGDNPGREEYVIPSEVLDKVGGRNGGELSVSFTSSEFIIWLNRGMRS